jgi:arginyl-tRNA synthetase
MVHFEKELKDGIRAALESVYAIRVTEGDIVLQETRKEFTGDFTLVVFPYTRQAGQSPDAVAKAIGSYLAEHTALLEGFNVVKGFLNLSVAARKWAEFFTAASASPQDVTGAAAAANTDPALLMVEYSSPNTNKPLHLGHIRNNLLGYSVAEILKAVGHRVIKVNLVNDRGIHICKSMLAWQRFGHGETPESSGLKGDHLVGKYYVLFDQKYREQVRELEQQGVAKEDAEKQAPLMGEVQAMLRDWERGDAGTLALWKTMNGWVYDGFAETYTRLGVDFDKTYYESETYLLGKKIVEQGLAQGVFFRKDDGSVWVDLTDAGLDQKVLLRSDGTSVYMTQDLGTAQQRFDETAGLQQLVYVVGNEQDYHFKVLKEIFRKMGRPWADGLVHLSYGMVDLPGGKMKSREGTVVDADDLIREITEEAEMATKALGKIEHFESEEARRLYHDIGMGALKYFILKVDPKKRMLFNPAESIDLNGHTGPFIQYTYARTCSVMAKGARVFGSSPGGGLPEMDEAEKALVRQVYRYPSVLREAAGAFSPALVANYVYDLAKAYNHFYHDHVVVDPEQPVVSAFRLSLTGLVSELIRHGLGLLGIAAPRKM